MKPTRTLLLSCTLCALALAPTRAAAPAAADGAARLEAAFKSADKNGDGKLDRTELPAALFDRLDVNKDGFVTEEEAKALSKPRR